MSVRKQDIKVDIFKTVEVDSFEQGCDPSTKSDMSLDTWKEQSIQSALNRIEKEFSTPYIFEDRLIVQRMETADGDEPTEKELESWKKGKCILFSATYDFYISMVNVVELDYSDLKKVFPQLKDA
jgi:hypothetical protein